MRDLENRIVLLTRGAGRLYGFSKQEALGRVSHGLFQRVSGVAGARRRKAAPCRPVGRDVGAPQM